MLNATSSVLLQTMLIFLNKNLQNAESSKSIDRDISSNNTKVYCYEPFGCFKMSYPWTDEMLRPVSHAPEPPKKVDPKYCLYSRRNKDVCRLIDILDRKPMYDDLLMPYHRVYFISHGFIQNGNQDWIKKMTRELLKLSDCSVIVVDWSNGAVPPYPHAVANIRLVGAMTAYLINNIVVDIGVQPEFIHFIGHGLGAHMAAYAGQTMKENFRIKLGRITGLDPAEPHFSKTDPIVRLDPTDADFVDVIHTDAGPFISGGLGILQPVGHVDFYPNGGIDQPGCRDEVISQIAKGRVSFYRGIRHMISCNHIRSPQYFIDSINPGPCSFLGTECGSWEEFQNGTCLGCSNTNRCPFQTKFGLHADTYLRKGAAYGSPLKLPPRNNIKLYLITGAETPYCRHHFLISWNISDSCKSLLHGGEVGRMWVTIRGEKGTTSEIKLTELEQYYEPGTEHQVTVAGAPIGKLESATLRLEYVTNPLNPLTWRFATTPRIYISGVHIKSLEEQDSLVICSQEDILLSTRKSLTLRKAIGVNGCKRKPIQKQREECIEDIR